MRCVLLLMMCGASASGARRREAERESQTGDYPIAAVLKDTKFAAAFESGSFPTPFPPVVMAEFPEVKREKRSPTCRAKWKTALAIGGKNDEKLQEVGFYRFFSEFYPHTKNAQASDITVDGDWSETFIFLPFCAWAETYVTTHRSPTGEMIRAPEQSSLLVSSKEKAKIRGYQEQAIQLFNSRMYTETNLRTVLGLLDAVPGGRIFHIIPSGMMIPSWHTALVRLRALRVDSTKYGGPLQGIVPQSTSPENCPLELPYEDPSETRQTLVSIVGVPRQAKFGVYKELRPKVYQLMDYLQKSRGATDIDASMERTPENYAQSFFRSKFCFVVPGDSQSTSQSSRSMCGGCVPIFIVAEPRDLPFANVLDYSTFSIRMDPTTLLRAGGADALYDRLHAMVASGEYERLRQNVLLARPFFNYHRFDAKSPYGAAIASMVHDEEAKFS